MLIIQHMLQKKAVMVLESFNNGILYIDIAFVYNRCTVYKVFRIKGSDCMKIEKVNDNQIRAH